jgi:hypothetical protein
VEEVAALNDRPLPEDHDPAGRHLQPGGFLFGLLKTKKIYNMVESLLLHKYD